VASVILKNVTKQFKSVTAVDSLSIAVQDREFAVLVGPSGCGKTTALRHEVVGFSGGAKYLFPGISGGELLHFFHWLSAVMTCKETIGEKETPVRQVINKAMEKIYLPIHCLAMVVEPEAGLYGLHGERGWGHPLCGSRR
jgi:nickel-dependent lactate racemase